MTEKVTIQQLMKAANVTQAQLGEMLNVSQSRISQILNPKSDPKLSTLRDLSKALGVSIDVLVAHYQVWTNGGEEN
jgi:transcriptional regulator with XRE-family HTH domain